MTKDDFIWIGVYVGGLIIMAVPFGLLIAGGLINAVS